MDAEHILVVEDDDNLRAGIIDFLECSNYRVSGASDGVEALERLEQMPEPPALIVSDIRMPRMDGYQFLDAVRARPAWVSVPFIFLSAKGEKQDIRQGKLSGADDYVSKPFDLDDLLVAIRSSLSRYQQLNAALEARLDAIKRGILYIINHEFRTPLMVIVSYADLMAHDPSFQHSADLRDYVSGIVDGSDRLTRLVENFLLLAELESGLGAKVYDRRRERLGDLAGLAEEAVARVQEKASARGVTLRLTMDEPLPAVDGDRVYLQTALHELLDNAVRFSPAQAGATVTVRVGTDAGASAVSFSVCDEGPGIPAEVQDKLFDVFYQVDRERLEQGGAGAGLAIARRVAELHRGWLTVESKPGRGSCFELCLPVDHRTAE